MIAARGKQRGPGSAILEAGIREGVPSLRRCCSPHLCKGQDASRRWNCCISVCNGEKGNPEGNEAQGSELFKWILAPCGILKTRG
jgi:hypothetical protein